MGNAENGKSLFMKYCSTCHTFDKDGKHKIGPNLFGVVGRSCASTYIPHEMYNYLIHS